MKRRSLAIPLSLTLLLALAAVFVSSPARADDELYVTAKIPFTFTVENTTLPAGVYTIRRVEDPPSREMMIESKNGAHRVLFLTDDVNAITAAPKTELVFHTYGDNLYLSQLWQDGDTTGVELQMNRSEKEHVQKGEKAGEKRVPAQAGGKASRVGRGR